MKCKNCGAEVPAEFKFCTECGEEIPQIKVCPQCKKEVPLAMKFCGFCGYNFSKTENDNLNNVNMGDKNVIPGDVIRHKENYNLSGNATIIENEDETKKVVSCHVCLKNIAILNTRTCPICRQAVCNDCYDTESGMCVSCRDNTKIRDENKYKDALKKVYEKGRIELEDRKNLETLQRELGLSDEKANKLEDEIKSQYRGSQDSLTDSEITDMEEASKLFFDQGKFVKAYDLMVPIYYQHQYDENVLDLFLPILSTLNFDEALTIINKLKIDVLTAYLVKIDYYMNKDLPKSEKLIQGAERLWSDNFSLKCCRSLLNYKLYEKTNIKDYYDKFVDILQSIGEPSTKYEAMWKRKCTNIKDDIDAEERLQEEERRRKAEEEEQQRIAAQKRKEEEERRLEEERRRKEEEEEQRRIAEQQQKEEQERLERLAEEKRKQEEERIRQEEEKRLAEIYRKENFPTVSHDGDGDYRSINEALASVKEGATIILKPGTYNETLVLNKQVTIKGDNEYKTIIRIPSGPVCKINEKATLKNIYFENTNNGKAYSSQFGLVEIYSDCTIINCDFSNSIESGLLIRGDNISPEIDACSIHNCSLNGILILEKSKPLIINSNIYENGNEGIFVKDSSDPIIKDCSIYHNEFSGISVANKSTGTYIKCQIRNSQKFGVYVCDSANPRFDSCHIRENDSIGIEITNDSTGTFVNCKLYGNNIGLQELGLSNPNVELCDIHSNRTSGIEIAENSIGKYTNCKIYKNKSMGIVVNDSSKPIFDNCDIYENNLIGIINRKQSTGSYTSCNVHDNMQTGIGVGGASNPIVDNCEIYGNKHYGIINGVECTGTYTNCKIYDNKDTGIAISDSANPKVDSCDIFENGTLGVAIFTNSSGTFTNCKIHYNGWDGVEVDDFSKPRFDNCDIYQHCSSGLVIKKKGEGEFTNIKIYACGGQPLVKPKFCKAKLKNITINE